MLRLYSAIKGVERLGEAGRGKCSSTIFFAKIENISLRLCSKSLISKRIGLDGEKV